VIAAGFVLLIIATALALTVDVPSVSYGIKSDEATYAAAALSAAFDHDLVFERGDLERFMKLFGSGPEGIFLKRGKFLRVRVDLTPPFLHIRKRFDADTTRLYFGKALIYPLVVAPFVRVFGLNGFLLFHVWLLALVAVAAYLFLAAQSSSATAALLASAFLGATVLPVYGVFLMPEVFNFAIVFAACFLWLYKEVAPDSRLKAPWTDFAAAGLLGVAGYSKPIPAPVLVAPMIALAWLRGHRLRAVTIGTTAAATAGLLFVMTAINSGEFNYQGGDRKTFYAFFPFDAPDARWDYLGGNVIEEPGPEIVKVLLDSDVISRLGRNVAYFVAGRHFGLIPYYFPGALLIVGWLASGARRDGWRQLLFAGFLAGVLLLLIALPFTWSGGGGPPGNRYFANIYPALFFLVPPQVGLSTGFIAWVGGAIFTAKMLMNPFVAAKNPWLVTEGSPARYLPVELAMADDLPVFLIQPPRVRIPYNVGGSAPVQLYFLDHHSWLPEPEGIWIDGGAHTEMIVSSPTPIDHIAVEVESPVTTEVTMAMGGSPISVTLEGGTPARFALPARGVQGRRLALRDFLYLLTAASTNGFTPHLMYPGSSDSRYLGARFRFMPVSGSGISRDDK